MQRMKDLQFARLQPFFVALGNKDRFEIMRLLATGPKTVTEVYETLHFKQTKVSNDLRRLRECGYVQVEKRGNERLYSINPAMLELLSSITAQVQDLTTVCEECAPNQEEEQQ